MSSFRKIDLKILIKSVGITVILIVIVLTICITPIFIIEITACGNDILQEIYSPEDLHKLVIYHRDCGATTRIKTHGAIIAADSNQINFWGNVFSVDDIFDPSKFSFVWESNNSLKIIYREDVRFILKFSESYSTFSKFYINYQVTTR